MRILKFIKVRLLFFFLILIIGLHLIVSANKTYMVLGRAYDKEQYRLFISSIDIENRESYIANTVITYFAEYPDWTPNIFYIAELIFILSIWALYMMKQTNEKLKINKEGVEKLQDLMLEIGIATSHPKHK